MDLFLGYHNMDGNKPGSREPDFEPRSKKQKQKSEKTNKEEIKGEQGIEGGGAPSRSKKEGSYTCSLPTEETTWRLPELGEGEERVRASWNTGNS